MKWNIIKCERLRKCENLCVNASNNKYVDDMWYNYENIMQLSNEILQSCIKILQIIEKKWLDFLKSAFILKFWIVVQIEFTNFWIEFHNFFFIILNWFFCFLKLLNVILLIMFWFSTESSYKIFNLCFFSNYSSFFD